MKSSNPPSPPTDFKSEPEEGSAEYIRQRYFPDAPANDPNLAWMQQTSSQPETESISSLRFDLSGKPISPLMSSNLPTHLGLHHHAEGTHAGYTLDDIFLLSRSSVPAQRATMLGVLGRIAYRIARLTQGEEDGLGDLVGKEEELRKRIVAAGVEAMSERGSVGARAVEVVWQCVVGWDEEISSIGGIELETPTDDALKSLRLDFFLPQIAASLSQGDIVEETRSQLLDILNRLAQHSNDFANSITTTPKLIASLVQTFLLTPIPPTEDSSPPNPLALELLTTLTNSSRSNAIALQEPADAILKFIMILPPNSMYPPQLTSSLITSTLHFYTALASYGLYSHIASTAMAQLSNLGRYVASEECTSRRLKVAWMELLATWMVCAVDPHQTTPSHEILWSQIIGWGWNEEIDNLKDRLGPTQNDWEVWSGAWKVNTAWLEGARVNGIRGGSTERMECIEAVRSGFEDGREKVVVSGCLDAIRQDLSQLASGPIERSHLLCLRALAEHATTLVSVIRLWLACVPPLSDGPLVSPPFPLPFPQISDLCAKITVHPIWSLLTAAESIRHAYVYLRPLSAFLSAYLSLSRKLPGISEELWSAQALTILLRLLPGDEEFAFRVVEDLSSLVTPSWVTALGIQAPPVIWDRGCMVVIKPFLTHTLRPQSGIYVGPVHPTPRSIKLATTQRLPSGVALRTFGLPLTREWTLSPLDHLLRSGNSEVFKALPVSWDASEVDIVRASLLFTKITRETLHRFSLIDFVLTRDEAIFGCMKVFMLEHGQTHSDSTEEVFRDRLVGYFMDELLRPYTLSSMRISTTGTPVIPPPSTRDDLEKIATVFLGQTPFYQYYTDFVALYDAISFSHPLFARLLLPPTSMRYALDYRKHLWNDFGHVLKTVRTPVEQVICEDVREYLWPIEKDPQMIGFYLRALLKEHLQGFVYLVALHHVASNVWLDLHDGAGWNEDRASKLLNAVVAQGRRDVVKEVVRYRQTTTGASLIPPKCFEDFEGQVKVSRLDCATRWGLADRLQGLFDNL